MTTIINTPPPQTEDSSAGIVLGIIFGALFVILLLVFGVRYYHGKIYESSSTAPTQSTVVVPAGTTVNITAPAPTTNTGY